MASPGKIVKGPEITKDLTLDCDFCVVGSGPGGATAAAVLAQAGATVVVLEAGGHHTAPEFNMQEAWAYPTLYQEHGGRATKDLSIMVLQGRTVGGGSTVNWTSSFRTPDATLALWRERFGLHDLDAALLGPHHDAVAKRLSIRPGIQDDVNANNRPLQVGAARLGWNPELIPRAVVGCARLGYCGMGCPIGAAQSALVTYVTDLVAAGGTLHANCNAVGLETDGRRLTAVIAEVLAEPQDRPTWRRVTVRPRRGAVLAGGAINTPALLLRSGLGKTGPVGQRTFLHPAVPMVAVFDERVDGFYGPPQSVASYHHSERGAEVGFFLETAPVHPALAAMTLPGHGAPHRELMARMAHLHAGIALLIDGHHGDTGGRVRCSDDGRIELTYELQDIHRRAAVFALQSMARLQLAAGAREVLALFDPPLVIRSEADIARLAGRGFRQGEHPVFSAHQMGGCAMGHDPATSVVSARGRMHAFDNIWIADGSIFPTGVGANPQVSIYTFAHLFASELARAG